MATSHIRSTTLTSQIAATRHPTRRSFLRQSVHAGLGLGLLCTTEALVLGQELFKPAKNKDGYFVVPAEAQSDPLMALKRSHLARYSGDHFETVNDYGAPVILNLFKVEDLRSQRDLLAKGVLTESEAALWKEASFALLFRGPLEMPLRQRSYKLAHHTLGKLEIFLVPVGKDEGARFYEAVFNRSLR